MESSYMLCCETVLSNFIQCGSDELDFSQVGIWALSITRKIDLMHYALFVNSLTTPSSGPSRFCNLPSSLRAINYWRLNLREIFLISFHDSGTKQVTRNARMVLSIIILFTKLPCKKLLYQRVENNLGFNWVGVKEVTNMYRLKDNIMTDHHNHIKTCKIYFVAT